MIIRLEGALYKTDPWVAGCLYRYPQCRRQRLFARRDAQDAIAPVQAGHGPDPRRYFRWGFDRDSFWLQQRTDQRMDPNTNGLYPHKLLTVMAYSDTNSLPQTN